MLYACWLLTWLYILIIINFKPYYNAWYTYEYQYLHPKGALQYYLRVKQLDNLGSNSLVTVERLKLLIVFSLLSLLLSDISLMHS